jgi:hypothetical protein
VEQQRVSQHHVSFVGHHFDRRRPAGLVQEGMERLVEVVGL